MAFETGGLTKSKKKDDELLILVILAALFTLTLIGFDIWYSSIGAMHKLAQAGVWIGHIGLASVWVIVFGKWKDPDYDFYRKVAFILAAALMLIIGIHHATSREDEQVIIDSTENAAKP